MQTISAWNALCLTPFVLLAWGAPPIQEEPSCTGCANSNGGDSESIAGGLCQLKVKIVITNGNGSCTYQQTETPSCIEESCKPTVMIQYQSACSDNDLDLDLDGDGWIDAPGLPATPPGEYKTGIRRSDSLGCDGVQHQVQATLTNSAQPTNPAQASTWVKCSTCTLNNPH